MSFLWLVPTFLQDCYVTLGDRMGGAEDCAGEAEVGLSQG